MDVDEGGSVLSERLSERLNMRITGDILYAKSDQLAVSFYASLPVELKQVLKNAGMMYYLPIMHRLLTLLSQTSLETRTPGILTP